MSTASADGSTSEPDRQAGAMFRLAVLSGNVTAIQLQIKKGTSPNSTDAAGRSVLMMAAARGHVEACRALIEAGARRDYRDPEGRDALAVAPQNNDELVAMLTDHGQDQIPPIYVVPVIQVPAGEPEIEASQNLGLSPDDFLWDPEDPTIEPDTDITVLAEALSEFRAISEHVATDSTQADWTDLEIYLPGPEKFLRRHGLLEGQRLKDVRRLLQNGLQHSLVSRSWVEAICDEAENRDELAMQLAYVLGDLGIEIESEDEWLASEDRIDEEESFSEARAATTYLRDLTQQENDVLRLYLREAGETALLTRETEVELAMSIEEGTNQALEALARVPAASHLLVECCEVSRAHTDRPTVLKRPLEKSV